MRERVVEALLELDALFAGSEPELDPDPPTGMTVGEAWSLYREAMAELAKKKGRKPRPKVEDAVRILLTKQRYADFSNHLVADIVRRMFEKHGLECKCSGKSVGWYVSQMGVAWNVIPRQPTAVPMTDDEGW